MSACGWLSQLPQPTHPFIPFDSYASTRVDNLSAVWRSISVFKFVEVWPLRLYDDIRVLVADGGTARRHSAKKQGRSARNKRRLQKENNHEGHACLRVLAKAAEDVLSAVWRALGREFLTPCCRRVSGFDHAQPRMQSEQHRAKATWIHVAPPK